MVVQCEPKICLESFLETSKSKPMDTRVPMREIERDNQKDYFGFSLFLLLILIISLTVYYIYFINQDWNIKAIGVFLLLFEGFVLVTLKNKFTQNVLHTYEIASIKRIVLVTNEQDTEKEWLCENSKAFLIGKSTEVQNVDIDLADLQCNAYISQEHAVMNYSNGYWYIEDLASRNGVGLKKFDEEYAYKLKPFTSYKLDEGDIIYISKAKLLLRG